MIRELEKGTGTETETWRETVANRSVNIASQFPFCLKNCTIVGQFISGSGLSPRSQSRESCKQDPCPNLSSLSPSLVSSRPILGKRISPSFNDQSVKLASIQKKKNRKKEGLARIIAKKMWKQLLRVLGHISFEGALPLLPPILLIYFNLP